MSSLVSCPICSKSVPDWYMNGHLDSECKGAGSADEGKCESSAPARDDGASTASPSRSRKRASMLPTQRHPPSSPSMTTKRARSGSSLGDAQLTDAPALLPHTVAAAEKTAPPGSQQSWAGGEHDSALWPQQGVKAAPALRLRNKQLPLAERLRPLTLDTFVGQKGLVGPGGILRTIIEGDQISSMVFWGSPGLGKTTLARIIARRTKAVFREMSAVSQNTADVKKAIDEAGNIIRLTKRRTILFLDEIHRFNKAQQDTFLPHLERGQIILIGATTENPSFRLNGALLSRCRVFHLANLTEEDISCIASRAAKLKQEDAGQEPVGLDSTILSYIASVSDGDARVAINAIDLAMSALPAGDRLTLEGVMRALQRSHVVYGADEHYDLISALHKSVRGSDANAALYWLGRMLQGGDDPLYVARRLVRMASEDIGLADNHALPLAMSTYQACQVMGMPECDTILAHCVTYLARAPKSVESYKAFNRVKAVLESENPWPVPLHLRNAPTRLMKDMGYGEGYKYNPDFEEPVDQDYLPEAM
ncbi:WRNIP1 protein, partial [Martensiomyces pterosporus]